MRIIKAKGLVNNTGITQKIVPQGHLQSNAYWLKMHVIMAYFYAK